MGHKPSRSNQEKVISMNIVHLNPGKFSDFYKVYETLGIGSYGEVRRVVHKLTNQERAAKIFRKDTESESSYQKLKKEIEILKILRHPSIVNIFEYFEDEKRIYILLEKCNGGELFDIVQQRACLSESVSALICKQILSAIAYMHDNNVVHRDLKLENILLEDTDELFAIKIIDFGTAILTKPNETLSELVGTSFYISPEVISSNYSKESDLWSCGVILYIMLCGNFPFDGPNNAEVFNKIKSGRVVFSGKKWEKVSEDAKSFVLSLLCPKENRISAKDALKHHWIKSQTRTYMNQQEKQSLKCSLLNFNRKNGLHNAVVSFINSQVISSKDTKELREIFRSLDINGDGRLSKEELSEGLLKFNENSEIIESIMKTTDADRNGFIDIDEFIIAAIDQKQLLSKENLRKAFMMFDLDGSQKISFEEMQTVLGVGKSEGKMIWNEVLNKLKKSRNYEIDFEEFCTLVSPSYDL